MKHFVFFCMSLFLAGCSVFGDNGSTKEPSFSVLKNESPFEIRQYGKIVVATTQSQGDFKKAQDRSFDRLFKYISGANTTRENISMTAPVITEETGKKIPMTAPVIMAENDKNWSMSFVLPENYTLQSAPKPTDPLVKLESLDHRKFAVITFKGSLTEDNVASSQKKLEQWMDRENLKKTGSALTAGYNPPWTLPSFRRNEILIPVE